MEFTGLTLEDERDTGGSLTTHFAVPPGRESEAAHDLLACLAAGAEIKLRNDLDEGGEGITFFRRTPAGLSSKVGGHGWQGQWQPIDEAEFVAAVMELAPHNRGGSQGQGSLVRYKRRD
jgi:hypothetical protein